MGGPAGQEDLPERLEELLRQSRALCHSDPAGMLDLAKSALEVAQNLEPDVYGEEVVADLQAQAWADLGNALRVADKLSLAEMALHKALELRQQGTSSPLLRARLAELTASLLCDQRQFSGALRLSRLAESIYEEQGAVHEASRAILRRGIQTARSGDLEEGICLLVRGLQRIDRDREPTLVLQTLHNILLFRAELGDIRAALLQLREMRPLYEHFTERIALIKLKLIEGKIFAGLGQLDRAEQAFLETRERFKQEGLEYDAALISLDLAMVWLQQGRKAEVRELVREIVETFQSRHIARETIAAFLLLLEAADPAG